MKKGRETGNDFPAGSENTVFFALRESENRCRESARTEDGDSIASQTRCKVETVRF